MHWHEELALEVKYMGYCVNPRHLISKLSYKIAKYSDCGRFCVRIHEGVVKSVKAYLIGSDGREVLVWSAGQVLGERYKMNVERVHRGFFEKPLHKWLKGICEENTKLDEYNKMESEKDSEVIASFSTLPGE